jgi:hypothetical protein
MDAGCRGREEDGAAQGAARRGGAADAVRGGHLRRGHLRAGDPGLRVRLPRRHTYDAQLQQLQGTTRKNGAAIHTTISVRLPYDPM